MVFTACTGGGGTTNPPSSNCPINLDSFTHNVVNGKDEYKLIVSANSSISNAAIDITGLPSGPGIATGFSLSNFGNGSNIVGWSYGSAPSSVLFNTGSLSSGMTAEVTFTYNNSPNFTPLASYTSGTCSITSDSSNKKGDSIEDWTKWTLFPNPTSSELNIIFDDTKSEATRLDFFSA